MDETKRAVLFDALREEGVSHPTLFVALLKHWPLIEREMGGRFRTSIREAACFECGASSWKRFVGTKFPANGQGMFLVHSPRCNFGSFMRDFNESMREGEIEVCWNEALIEDAERAKGDAIHQQLTSESVSHFAWSVDPWNLFG